MKCIRISLGKSVFFFLIVDLILIVLFVSAVERMPEYFSLPVSNISSS